MLLSSPVQQSCHVGIGWGRLHHGAVCSTLTLCTSHHRAVSRSCSFMFLCLGARLPLGCPVCSRTLSLPAVVLLSDAAVPHLLYQLPIQLLDWQYRRRLPLSFLLHGIRSTTAHEPMSPYARGVPASLKCMAFPISLCFSCSVPAWRQLEPNALAFCIMLQPELSAGDQPYAISTCPAFLTML